MHVSSTSVPSHHLCHHHASLYITSPRSTFVATRRRVDSTTRQLLDNHNIMSFTSSHDSSPSSSSLTSTLTSTSTRPIQIRPMTATSLSSSPSQSYAFPSCTHHRKKSFDLPSLYVSDEDLFGDDDDPYLSEPPLPPRSAQQWMARQVAQPLLPPVVRRRRRSSGNDDKKDKPTSRSKISIKD